MVGLDIGRDMLGFNEGRAKEDEGIWRTGDVARRLLFAMFRAAGPTFGSVDAEHVAEVGRGVGECPDDLGGRRRAGGRHIQDEREVSQNVMGRKGTSHNVHPSWYLSPHPVSTSRASLGFPSFIFTPLAFSHFSDPVFMLNDATNKECVLLNKTTWP